MKESKSEIKKIDQTIHTLGKTLPVFIRGQGNIPLLVLGQASLFKKPGFIPKELDAYFKIYFVDLFEKQENQSFIDVHTLKLDSFINAIESIRSQLGLEKIALFAHSASGVLAIEYSRQYQKNVLLNIIVGTAPIWGNYKNKLSEDYFKHNATLDRHCLFKQDQQALFESKEKKDFSKVYMARRTLFFSNPRNVFWQSLWEGVNQDEALIDRYFQLIQDYDIRKRPYYETPIFLALGLRDYSAPFYAWTDDIANSEHRFRPLEEKAYKEIPSRAYYIFNAAHFPMLEDSEFPKKILFYIRQKFPQWKAQSSSLSIGENEDAVYPVVKPQARL